MKLNSLREILSLTILLHSNVKKKKKKNQKMTKGHSFKTLRRLLMYLLTLRSSKPHIYNFVKCFSFSHFWVFSSCIWNFKLMKFTSRNTFIDNSFAFKCEKKKKKKSKNDERTLFQDSPKTFDVSANP